MGFHLARRRAERGWPRQAVELASPARDRGGIRTCGNLPPLSGCQLRDRHDDRRRWRCAPHDLIESQIGLERVDVARMCATADKPLNTNDRDLALTRGIQPKQLSGGGPPMSPRYRARRRKTHQYLINP